MSTHKSTHVGKHAADLANDYVSVAADAIDDVADVVEHQTLELGGEAVAKLSRTAKRKIESAADYVRDSDATDMANVVVRRAKAIAVPLAMAVGLLAVGFLTARWLRRR